jgi:hypothetical protein
VDAAYSPRPLRKVYRSRLVQVQQNAWLHWESAPYQSRRGAYRRGVLLPVLQPRMR